MVKNLPEIQEILVQSLGREDALEKGMASHSSILAWRIPWTEEPGGSQELHTPHPWDSPSKNTGVGCHCLLQCMKVKSESEVA